MIAARKSFGDRTELASTLASDIAKMLAAAIAARGVAHLAVSGGTTPKLFFRSLSQAHLPWHQVSATLADERCVEPTSEQSNARLVHEELNPDDLNFVPLYGNEAAALKLLPFDAAVLGMGIDGHTASLFPGGDRLHQALDRNAPPGVIAMTAPGAEEPRLTFNLSALLQSAFLALHIEGEEKRRVLAEAERPGPVEAMPIRAVLRAPEPVTLYWCP